MKMGNREQRAVQGFLSALQSANETSERARQARERLSERTRAEPERVLAWLASLPEGRERNSAILRKLRLIATNAVFEKMQAKDEEL